LGFGRRAMTITPEDAYAYFVYQIGALAAALHANGMTLHHVKAHGALYLMLHENRELAAAAVQAIADSTSEPAIYSPAPLGRTALRVEADSIWVHGDGPNVTEVVRAVRETLEQAGVEVRAVAPAAEARHAAAAGR